MRVAITLGALLFTTTYPAFARLGDTPSELTDRYGEASQKAPAAIWINGRSYVFGETLQFRQDDWNITCVLTENRCSKITYTRAEPWAKDHYTALPAANAQGSQWSTETDHVSVKAWRRQDGGTARLAILTLVITNPAYNRAVATVESKAHAENKRAPKKS